MKCPKCNNEINDNTSVCASCGERIDPAVVPAPAPNAPLPDLPQSADPKLKKKSRLPLVLCVILLFALAAGSVVVYAMTFQKRDFMQFIQGKEAYARNLVLDGVSSGASGIKTALGFADLTQEQTHDLSSGIMKASVGFTGSDADKRSLLRSLEFFDGELLEPLMLLLDSKLYAEIAWGKNMSFDYDMQWLLKDAQVLSLGILLREQFIYFNIPQLLSKTLALDVAELGFNSEEIFSELTNISAGNSNDEMVKYLQDNRETLSSLINDTAGAMMNEINSLEVEDNVTLKLGDSELKLDRVTYILKDDELEAAIDAFAELIESSPVYQDFIVELFNIAQPGIISNTMLLSSLKEIKSESISLGEDLSVSLYVDAKNQIKAFSMEDETLSVRFASVEGTGWELSLEQSGTSIMLNGKLEGSADNMSGDMNLRIKSGFVSIDFKILDFSYSEDRALVSIPVGDILHEASKLVPISLMGFDDFLYNSVLTFEAGMNSEDELELTTAFKNKVNELGVFYTLGADLSGKTALAQIPSESELSYFDMHTGEGIDLLELITNVSALIEQIEGMGYNIDFLYEILGGMMGY